jgi:hypothetical protein
LVLVVLRPVDSEVASVDSCVDSEPRLLLVVLRPVLSELTPLIAVLIPVEAEVDNDVTLVLVVLKPVDSEVASAGFCVDSEPRVLLVVLRPVLSGLTPLIAALIPVEADVDNELTLPLVATRPVDSELTLLFVVPKPVEMTLTLAFVVLRLVLRPVLTEYNWPPFTASVEPDATFPFATLTILRCCAALPTLTTFAAPLSVLSAPSATEFVPVAVALEPIAVVFVMFSEAALVPDPADAPTATFPLPLTYCPAFKPIAVLLLPVTL